jgi:hypothetical protein
MTSPRTSDTALSDPELGALRRLLDRQAIVDCVLRYARCVDRDDEELVRSAYHPDVVEDHGGYVGGLEQLIPFLAAAHRPFPGYQRYVTNFTVEIDGDEAHTESYWLCVLRRDDAGQLLVNGGRYVDRLERRNGEWRIANRVVVIEWSGTVEGGGPDLRAPVQPRRDRDDVSYQRPLTVSRPPGEVSVTDPA